jgi:general secretion pathway protein N
VQTPAATLYGWIATPALPVQLYGIEGSVFSGRAQRATRGTQPLLDGLSWRLQPWTLPLGRATYRVRTDKPPLLVDGKVAVGLGGPRISDLKGNTELRTLAAAAGQAFVPLAGQVGLELRQLRLRDGWPAAAAGRLQLIGLSWALGREPVPLGDYQVRLGTEDGGEIVAQVATLAGVLEADGGARLKADRSYELSLRLRPRADAPPLVANLLQQLGRPDAQGYYLLQQSGRAGTTTHTVTMPQQAPSPEPQHDEVPARQQQQQQQPGHKVVPW